MHEFGAGTHVGNSRDNNEDSYVCDPDSDLWIVADGMGGLGFGEVASAISTFTIARQVKDGHGINQAIEFAHRKIKDYAETEANGTNMGTTMVLLLSQGSLYNIFWVGDSRAYLFDNGTLSQLTTDHSLVQSLIEQGELTTEEAISDPRKNVVTRALGVQEMETVRADSVSEKWQANQKILLCSDGLTDCVRQAEIETILNKEGSDQQKVDALIQAALNGGGTDNITVVLVSASNTAKRSESDTHIPSDVTDSTLVPEDLKSTMAPNNLTDGSPIQGNLAISDLTEGGPAADSLKANLKNTPSELQAIRTASGVPEQQKKTEVQKQLTELDESDIAITSKIKAKAKRAGDRFGRNWVVTIAIAIAVLTFARLTTAEKAAPQNFSPTQLLEITSEAEAPLARLDMPDIAIPESASVLQLGIFSRLQGAETRQHELSREGFLTSIEKRVTPAGTQYVVLLGPFFGNKNKEITSAQLDRAGISHFERQGSHY